MRLGLKFLFGIIIIFSNLVVVLQSDKTNVYAFGYEPFLIPNSQQTAPNYEQQCFDEGGSRLEYGGYAFLCIIYIYDPNLTDIERGDLNFRLYNEESWDCYQNKVILCHVHQYTKDPCLPGNVMGSPEYTQCHENLNQMPPNNPPVVIITSDPDPVIRNTQGTLNGSQSYDPDQGDQIVEYQWKILDDAGYNIVLSNPSSSFTSFTAPLMVPAKFVGEESFPEIIPLRFSLTVTDTHGQTGNSEVEVMIKCSQDDEETCQSANVKVYKLLQWAKDNGYNEFYKRLQHWVAGSGNPLPLDVDWLKETESIQNAEAINQQRFMTNQFNEGNKLSIFGAAKGLLDRQSVTIEDNWDVRICWKDLDCSKNSKYPDINSLTNGDIDFVGAVGTTQLHSEGTFTITRQLDIYTIKGTVIHSISDVFNFNPGDVFPIPVFPLYATSEELNKLEECRGAESFLQENTWTQEISAIGTLDKLGKDSKDWYKKYDKKDKDNIWKWTDIA